MLNDSVSLTEDLIIYSVKLDKFEKLDFKDDALAGIRANYFNFGRISQSETSEITIGGSLCRFSYSLQSDKSLTWKVTKDGRPYQSVKRETNGIYCVIFYEESGIVYKRIYFDKNHYWLRTEYYDHNYDNVLLAKIYPSRINGIVTLVTENYDDVVKEIKTLYPSEKSPDFHCSALIYSNNGMLWYDTSFKPANVPEQNSQTSETNGFNFKSINNNGCVLDFDDADYLDDAEDTVDNIEYVCSRFATDKYSAYDKIAEILAEVHKTSKDLFGEVDEKKSSSDVPEIESETSPKDESTEEPDNTENPCGGQETDYESCQEPECDSIIINKSGKYTYYGELDANNRRIGRGRTVTEDGLTSYDGNYEDDKRSGFGVCYYKNGKINYVGNWINNKRSGSGVGYRSSDGTLHAGRWNNNLPDNCGARFDSDGNFIDVCFYKNGVRNGKCVSFDESGNIVVSIWKSGILISEKTIEIEENI